MRHIRPLIKRSFGQIITETPYNQSWVEAIKAVIPQSRRKWTGGQEWSFDPMYYSCIRTIIEHHFGTAYTDATGGVSEPQTSEWVERWNVYKDGVHKQHERESYVPPPRQMKTVTAYQTLYVTPNAPKEVVTAAWRALSKLHHEANGGDQEVLARINAAHTELKKQGRTL